MIQEILRAGSPTAGYALAPDAALVLLRDGTSRLLDLGGSFFALSESATLLLSMALRDDLATGTRLLAARHGVPREQIQGDLAGLLRPLERAGAVRRTPLGHVRPEGFRAWLLAGLVRGVLALSTGTFRDRALLALAYGTVHLAGWPAAVRIWERASRPRAMSAPTVDPEAIDRGIRTAAARHALPVECKERALCCWALLRRARLPARLVVGIDLHPFTSHVWCESAGAVLSDYEDRCQRFTPVVAYDGLEDRT